MNVGEICSRIVVVAESSTPVQQAAKLMRDHHIGALVVTAGGTGARRPIGIVTDRDLVVEVVAADVDYRTLTVGDIMSERPATINETAGLFEVIAQMRSGGVRRLVVVDANGHLLGIVAMDDLIPVLAEEQSALAQAKKADEMNAKVGVQNFEPLRGIPLGIKDNFLIEGVKTTCASKILKNYIPPYTATAVRKLIEQGARGAFWEILRQHRPLKK